MGLFVIVLGALLLAAGLLWPWPGRLGLAHPPGDISIRSERFSFYFPITSCVVVSLVLSFVVWLLNR
ncbi:DUF2905 family protein [Acidocella aminolytica]|uniref:DUF2905 family protein n=1 Tax=Acidocella aminolytica TaxID=33998 RepID=UPI00090F4AB9|nr:DUF2905 family protein [Acidocella aminolytica]SHE58795.1 Protein of unknown function [Acidocella aminolytica 101 = DSM 11237]